MRPAPLSLPSIVQLGAFHPAMRRVDGRFTPYNLPIPEKNHNRLTSIPAGSFSNLTSLWILYLVRDASRPALAPYFRFSPGFLLSTPSPSLSRMTTS